MRNPQLPSNVVRAETRPEVPLHIAAQAAAWIARLHGPLRSPQMERRCRQWQELSEAHRVAFERCTATWEETRGVSNAAEYYARIGATSAESAATAAAARLIERIRTLR